MQRCWRVGTLALAVGLAAAPAFGLTFKPVRDNQVLLVYDCGRLPGEKRADCLPHQTSFSGPVSYDNGQRYAGDNVELERLLAQGSYQEVWLFSGGGNLDQGVKVGELLRKYNQFVRVPSGATCVSACTVAFLGGRVRDIDPDATYKVHAYSGHLNSTDKDLAPLAGPDGEFELARMVKDEVSGARFWVRRLLVYVQRMIGGAPDVQAIDAALAQVPDAAQAYHSSGRFRSDLERIRREGVASTQEILMRIERETFEVHLAELKKRSAQLGPRAAHAVRMLENMFSSRIAGTADLDQRTLKEDGYINVRR